MKIFVRYLLNRVILALFYFRDFASQRDFVERFGRVDINRFYMMSRNLIAESENPSSSRFLVFDRDLNWKLQGKKILLLDESAVFNGSPLSVYHFSVGSLGAQTPSDVGVVLLLTRRRSRDTVDYIRSDTGTTVPSFQCDYLFYFIDAKAKALRGTFKIEGPTSRPKTIQLSSAGSMTSLLDGSSDEPNIWCQYPPTTKVESWLRFGMPQ